MYKDKPITKARTARAVLRRLEFQHLRTEQNWDTAGDNPEKLTDLNKRLKYLREHIIEVIQLMVMKNWPIARPQNEEIAGRRKGIIKSIQRYYETV